MKLIPIYDYKTGKSTYFPYNGSEYLATSKIISTGLVKYSSDLTDFNEELASGNLTRIPYETT